MSIRAALPNFIHSVVNSSIHIVVDLSGKRREGVEELFH
jgi:hypothetical protein